MALGKCLLRVNGLDSANRTAYQFSECMFQGYPNFPLTKDRQHHPKTNTLGLVECNIHVPNDLREKFAEIIPMFQNIEVTIAYIDDYMKPYAEKNKLLSGSRRTLIGSYKAGTIPLVTPLLKCCIDVGLKVTKI